MIETWVPVRGFRGYECSSFGRVRSTRRGKHKLLSLPPKSNGYLQVILCRDNGEHVNWSVHRLVGFCFFTIKPQQFVLHKDGDKSNNRTDNLKVGHAVENAEDAFQHGTLNMGEKHYKAKLSKEDVLEIRLDLLLNVPQADIARRYGVHKTTISKIATGVNWRRTS